MRTMLDIVGVHTRGQKLSSDQLVKLCRDAGLPIGSSEDGPSHRSDDR